MFFFLYLGGWDWCVGRSVSMVLLFAVSHSKMTMKDALEYVKARRSSAGDLVRNVVFQLHLGSFEIKKLKRSSYAFVPEKRHNRKSAESEGGGHPGLWHPPPANGPPLLP